MLAGRELLVGIDEYVDEFLVKFENVGALETLTGTGYCGRGRLAEYKVYRESVIG